jgi:hypothetical protein
MHPLKTRHGCFGAPKAEAMRILEPRELNCGLSRRRAAGSRHKEDHMLMKLVVQGL